MLSQMRDFRFHQMMAAAVTVLLHAGLIAAVWVGTSGKVRPQVAEKPIPVQLLQESPQDVAAVYGRASQSEPQVPVNDTTIPLPKPTKKVSKHTQETHPVVAPPVPESVVDCRYMDETACSPCLAEPKICKACCQASEKPGAGGTDADVMSSPVGTCVTPPCAPTDPCSKEVMAEMTSSFCPRVRSSIYAHLGTIRLTVPEDATLSARIQVTVNATGALKLEGMLSSSGHPAFDQSVRDSVAKAAAVVPPARLLHCAAARGCIFPVTIGANKAPSAVAPSSSENEP